MPSHRTDASGWQLGEIWCLGGATAALAILLARSPGVVDASGNAPILLGALPLLALSIVRLARRAGYHCLHMSIFMVVAGTAVLLLGARLDFGPFGLITLADWCSALPDLRLGTVWTKVALSPWSHAGMLIGCNLGMVLAARRFDPMRMIPQSRFWRYLACNIGMLSGMLLAEAALPAVGEAAVGESAVVNMLWIMVAGMTAGIWVGWWVAALMGRIYWRAITGAETAAMRG